jgi:2-polyprenyl-6-methoxyphenol hydroxylase-like FAD-dependent oxidoreductase
MGRLGGKASRRFREIGTSEPPAGARVLFRRAVVLGGSVAGLVAARVLSDHAEEVLIIERDDLRTVGGSRSGVPQGAQLHVLLDGGRVQLDRWYPGFSAELIRNGAVRSAGDAIQMYVDGVCRVPVPSDEIISASRPFLEEHVRRRTLARRNVRLLRGQARSLTFDGARVSGVGYSLTDEPDILRAVRADFVIDATGRSSRLGDWLAQGGWPKPAMRRMGIDLNYATACFRHDGRIPGASTIQAIALPGRGRRPSVSALSAVEGNRWMMLLAGFAGDRPTRDPEDYLSRSRDGLPPVFAQVTGDWPMTGPVMTFRQADSRRRDFDRLRRFPAGLAAIGDAVASFNPVYGQGMSSAVLHASCLSAYLRSGASPDRPARDYFDRVRVVVDAAWQTSTLNDLALPHVTGPYPPGYRIARVLSDLIVRASITDLDINRRFIQVTHMRAHPATVLGPRTLLRAARVAGARRHATPPADG